MLLFFPFSILCTKIIEKEIICKMLSNYRDSYYKSMKFINDLILKKMHIENPSIHTIQNENQHTIKIKFKDFIFGITESFNITKVTQYVTKLKISLGNIPIESLDLLEIELITKNEKCKYDILFIDDKIFLSNNNSVENDYSLYNANLGMLIWFFKDLLSNKNDELHDLYL